MCQRVRLRVTELVYWVCYVCTDVCMVVIKQVHTQ